MIHALAPSVIAVGASWSRSQERLSCTRVLRDRVYRSRSNATAQRNDGVAGSERRPLQVNGIHSHLEQPVRVGWRGRFYVAA